MTLTPDVVVAEAWSWVGTPFQPNQSVKGLGADCVGLVAGIALACGIKVPEQRDAYSLRPDGSLKPYLEKYLVRVPEADAADILLMAFADEPHHLAFYTGSTIIHAFIKSKKCIEQPMTHLWWKRVHGIYRIKELAGP